MYPMPAGYDAIKKGDVAQIDVYLAIGTNIDPTSADDLTEVSGEFLPMSNPTQITDANYKMTEGLATFEGEGIKTARGEGLIAPPLSAVSYPPQVGLWSAGISDKKGYVDFTVELRFSKKHTSAFTVYPYDQSITEATLTYYDGAQMTTRPMVALGGRIQEPTGGTYDRLVLHVTRIDQPLTHVKVAEIEFGASETFGKDSLTGEVTLIQEWDPTMQSIPLFELDFSLINVFGEFDPDNPAGRYDSIKQDYPAELSFSISGEDGKRYTVPCGRFMISSKKATESSLDIVSLDARSALSNNRRGLSLKSSVSFGDTFTELFEGLNIPFTADEGLFMEYPDQNIDFDGDKMDLLTIMKYVEQYYDIWLIPEREGTIRVSKVVASDDYGVMEPNIMITYPLPDVAKTFNFISVAYDDGAGDKGEFVLDMRTDPAQLRSQIAVKNPLVRTKAKAEELATKVRRALFGEQVRTEWLGDPSLDITDFIEIEGKWTKGVPVKYRTLYQELTYDGGIRAETVTYRRNI